LRLCYSLSELIDYITYQILSKNYIFLPVYCSVAMSESDSGMTATTSENEQQTVTADGNGGAVSGPYNADGNGGAVSGPYNADGNGGAVSGPYNADGNGGAVSGP
jgi:hypothetical protein